jgi:histidine triad (HIT) family protein
MTCLFCTSLEAVLETDFFIAVFDIDPIQQGHILVTTKRHVKHWNELTTVEELDFLMIQKKLISVIETTLRCDGVTVLLNNGRIMDEGTHLHIHFVPRYVNDAFWDHQHVQQIQANKEKLKERLKGAF